MLFRTGRAVFLGVLLLATAALTQASAQQAPPPAPANAADEKQQAVDALFRAFERTDSPGVAVGIYQDGKAAYLRGYGIADLDQGKPVTPQTMFRAASVSKQFTAFAIALLVRDGKVTLDADIHTYLPELPDFGQKITVRDLVHHLAGLKDSNLLLWLANRDSVDRLGNTQVMALLQRQRQLLFAPGSQFSYSNTGYILLAEIVRAASGQSFREFTTARIFQPLGMTSSWFLDDVTQVVPNRAESYTRTRTGWQRSLINAEFLGSTGLVTTAEDLVKWAGNFDRPVVGDAALIELTGTSGKRHDGKPVNYGFGLMHETMAGHDTVMHTGSIAGYRSIVVTVPGRHFGVVMVANHSQDLSLAAEKIIEIYLGKATPAPGTATAPTDRGPPIQPSPEQLQTLVGHYLGPKIWSADLMAEGGKLFWLSTTLPKAELTLRAGDSFSRGEGGGARYFQFVRDAKGGVTGFRAVTGSGDTQNDSVFQKIAPVQQPAAAALRELEGDYRVAEVDATYTFQVQDGQLTARTLWMRKPAKLTLVAADRYDTDSVPIGSLAVQRDKAGKPTGFRIVGGGLVGTVFERLPAARKGP